jgi:integrase
LAAPTRPRPRLPGTGTWPVGRAYPATSPAAWNRHLAALRSFSAWCARQGWLTQDPTRLLERRHVPVDHDRALSRQQVEQILTARHLSVRDRALFRMLYETAARAQEVLRLNVEDLDTSRRRASTVRKGGDLDVIHWQTGTARLLPHVIAGRTHGPLFLAERAPSPSRAPAAMDLDESTGRPRLSYRRAAEVFKTVSGGATLHQLRHSALTHLAEEGVPLPLLMPRAATSPCAPCSGMSDRGSMRWPGLRPSMIRSGADRWWPPSSPRADNRHWVPL